MSPALYALTLAAALGCATMAGAFYAFSAFVMDGLARLPQAQGIAAMQSINITAVRPAFMTGFVGTAAVCAVLVVWSLVTWGERPAALLLAGGALYLVGALLLTRVYHVPRNDALDTLDPDGADAAGHWRGYVASWTNGNHLRAIASLAAGAAFTVALTV
jgi:uncharacterized membrane protein